VACWLHKGAHALLGLAMVAMAWPAVPGWLSLVALAPVGSGSSAWPPPGGGRPTSTTR